MSQLPSNGAAAPAFSLTTCDGNPVGFPNDNATGSLLFFFKRDCATCDLTAPLIEVLHQALTPLGLQVIGIAQDSVQDTTAVINRHNLSFTVTLDRDLDVSAEYGFDAVPALVLTDTKGKVQYSFEGFAKEDLLALAEQAAGGCGASSPTFNNFG